MEQIAAKLASLVPPRPPRPPPPPPQQPRNELVVEKTGPEKGRETGEARRRPLERSTVEVKGAGGILVLGGLLAAAAVAAGATIIARRAQAKRPPASKKERVEGFNGDHKSEQSQIDGSVGIPEHNRVSVKPKGNLFEDDTCNGAKELPNGRALDMDQVNEKICGKVDLGLHNGIGEEINSNDECQKCELLEQVEKILEKPVSDVVDETDIDEYGDDLVHEEEEEEEEEENEVASPYEAEHSVNHHETELTEYIPALDKEEKEDEPLPKQPQLDFSEADNGQFKTNELIQSADIEISKQECRSVCDRDQKVLTFLEEPKQSQLEMAAECKSDVSTAAGPLTFKDMVGQQKVEASQSDLAEEAKSQDISEQQTEQISDEYKREKEDNLEKYEEEVEGKKVPESSPEAAADEEMKEKKEAEAEAEASLQQKEDGKEEIEDKKENKSSPEGEEIKDKKEAEAEASPEGKEHEEEKEDKKDIDTPHEGDEKDEHEEVTEGKKELESSLEGGGDGTRSNQTQPHIIHSEVSTEEFSTTKETDEAIEKRQPASFAREEDGSKNNQIQSNIADPKHSAEEQSIVNEVEKMGEERQESDSSPEEAAQMRGDGSSGDRVSSANSNEAEIAPSEVVEQAEILMHEVESKNLSDSLITSGEVKDEVHVNKAEEKQEESRDKIPDNMVHANKAEEKEEQSIIGREKTTENIIQQQLMATIREKALALEKFLMEIPDRLLVGFMVMALTIVLLHYATKALS